MRSTDFSQYFFGAGTPVVVDATGVVSRSTVTSRAIASWHAWHARWFGRTPGGAEIFRLRNCGQSA
jgi:hypothetical protein